MAHWGGVGTGKPITIGPRGLETYRLRVRLGRTPGLNVRGVSLLANLRVSVSPSGGLVATKPFTRALHLAVAAAGLSCAGTSSHPSEECNDYYTVTSDADVDDANCTALCQTEARSGFHVTQCDIMPPGNGHVVACVSEETCFAGRRPFPGRSPSRVTDKTVWRILRASRRA